MASRDIRRISKKLEDIGKRVSAAIADEFLAASDSIVAGQKRRAPSDTGALRESIRHTGIQSRKDGFSVTITAGGAETTRGIGDRTYDKGIDVRSGDTGGRRKRVGGAGVTTDYAVEQEFGNQHMAANPFFYPEVRAQDKKIRRNVRKAFLKETRK